MIATGILHDTTWHWIALAWSTGFFILGLGLFASLLVTTALHPRQPGAWGRTLFTFGPAAAAGWGLLFFGRVAELIEPGFGPGPQYWLLGWVPGGGHDFVHPYDTLVALHILTATFASLLSIFSAVFLAPKRTDQARLALPGRWTVVGVVGFAVLAIPFFGYRVYPYDVDSARWLDLLGILPLFGVCIALRSFATLAAAKQTLSAKVEGSEAIPLPDFYEAWKAAGLVSADAAPLLRVEASDQNGNISERAGAAWTAIAAPGSPPESLDHLLGSLMDEPHLYVLGGMPVETENALLTALLADLVGAQGMRTLVLHPHPETLVDGLASALKRGRTWEPGAAVAGTDALQESLAGRQLPALVVTTKEDFARKLIQCATQEGRGWTTGLDLLIVHRPDVGQPIEVTHTAFAFRRWHLATRRLVQPPVLVTVPDSAAHRAFAERLFPGRAGHRIPYGARSVAASVAWPGSDTMPGSALPWLGRAATVVADLEHSVTAIDPAGSWSHDAFPRKAVLTRDISWSEAASVSDFRAADVAEAVATLPHRLPEPGQHVSLWAMPDDPVSRFLRPERVQALVAEGRLPHRAPIVGTRNRFLRLAHLDIALRESVCDERSLRAAFGDDLVDFRLRTTNSPAVRSSNHTAWRERGEIVRSPQLQGSAVAAHPPRADTVTSDTATILEERTGEVLCSIDGRTAVTQYYPKRVFAIGTRQYVVPMHAFDAKRMQLRVRLANERDRVTRPVLTFELEHRTTTIERITRRHKRFSMHTLAAECAVTERVHAAWVPSLDQEERFDVVEARYDSELRFIFPESAEKGLGLFHLAAVVEALLPLFLRCEPSQVSVTPVRAGFLPGMGVGIAVVDRTIGGIGFASALDDGTLAELLRWSRNILFSCSCMDGCTSCTPAQVLRVGGAKQDVLKMLEGL